MMTTRRTSRSGTLYPWLLSDYHADTWVLRDPEMSPKDAVRVDWTAALPDGTQLTDSRHRHLLETIRRVVILRRVGAARGARKSTDSARTQYTCALNLMGLVRWMLARGTERFGHLTPSDFAQFCQDARSGLHDEVTKLRVLAEGYQASGRTPPTYKKTLGPHVYLDRIAFLREAGLGRSGLSEVGYELSRLSVEVFKLSLTAPAQRAYEQGPPERKALTRKGIMNHLRSWADLWRYRDELPDPLSFQAINGSVKALADELGRDEERTPNIPPRVALWILDRSLRWVLHYGPDLLQLRDQVMALESEMRLKKVPDNERTGRRAELLGHYTPTHRGPAEPWPLSPSLIQYRGDGRLDLMRALNGYVAAACMIVIAAFSARRHEEVTKLKTHTKPELDTITGPRGDRYLNVWIEKTLQRWDQVPVPEVVVLAVDVLRRLSEPARQRGTNFLFSFLARSAEAVQAFSSTQMVPEFGKWLQTRDPAPEQAEPWHLAAHQLRRFFAYTYFHRYENADLAALSWMLRHSNLEKTLHYVTESAQGATMREVGTERTVGLLTDLALGQRQAGGAFAKRFLTEIESKLEELRRDLDTRIRVLGEHQVRAAATKWAVEHGIMLRPAEHAECACRDTPEDSAIANCRHGEPPAAEGINVQLGPNKAAATPSVCAGCPHVMVLGHHAPCWRRNLAELKATADAAGNVSMLRESSRLRYEKARRFVEANGHVLQRTEHAPA